MVVKARALRGRTLLPLRSHRGLALRGVATVLSASRGLGFHGHHALMHVRICRLVFHSPFYPEHHDPKTIKAERCGCTRVSQTAPPVTNMKLISVVALLAAPFAASATRLSWDSVYDQGTQSLSTVACSDGSNGLLARYGTFGGLPTFPRIGGSSEIANWNSPNCGSLV